MAHRIRVTHCLLAGGLLLAGSPALAQEGILFKNLIEGVIGGRGNSDIEYRQRPPLVVPPGAALRKPQEPASARNASWPNDPDVAKRRALNENALLPATEREKYKEQQRPLLSQDELRRGRVAGRDAAPVPQSNSKMYEENIGPIRAGRDLAARRNVEDLASLQYGVEPERRYLHEPPLGYRRPAGTAPVGPGQLGPREDQQASGEKEFAQGLPAPTVR